MFGFEQSIRNQFVPHEDGYVLYPTRWSPGHPVTKAEAEKLINDTMSFFGWRIFGLTTAIFIGLTVVLTMLANALGLPSWIGSTVSAIAFVLLMLFKAMAPQRYVWRREPALPPRSTKVADMHIGSQFGWPMMIWILLVSLSFLFWTIKLASDKPLLGVPLFLLFAVATFFNFRVAWRKWKNRGN